jgi:hypothetical protein
VLILGDLLGEKLSRRPPLLRVTIRFMLDATKMKRQHVTADTTSLPERPPRSGSKPLPAVRSAVECSLLIAAVNCAPQYSQNAAMELFGRKIQLLVGVHQWPSAALSSRYWQKCVGSIDRGRTDSRPSEGLVSASASAISQSQVIAVRMYL